LDDQALTWVVRLTSGESSVEDHARFREWRNQSPAHGEALIRARTLWQTIGSALPESERRQTQRNRTLRRLRVSLPIAACLLIGLYASQRIQNTWRFDQVTAPGEQRVLTLSDGSRVTMGGDSALNIDFRRGLRQVNLARGEALFAVRHDSRTPFVVHAGDADFRDVGTVFGVFHGGASARVVVAQGEVEALSGDQHAFVHAGQAVALTQRSLAQVQAVDSLNELAWTRGRLIVIDRPLSEIIATLGPHYRGHILLLRGSIGRQRLSASIELNHIEEWLDALKETSGVRITRVGNYTFLT
jgi:transmembrane sensor